MRLRAVVLFFVASVPALGARAEFEPSRFRVRRAIELPPLRESEMFVRIPLPREIFGRAAPGLSDLRVVEDERGEVRYHVVVLRPHTERRELSPRLLNLGRSPTGETAFELHLPAAPVPPSHNRFELSLTGDDFIYKARVDGSHDGRLWLVLADEGWVYRLGDRGAQTDRVALTYPESTYGILRVTLLPLRPGKGAAVEGARLFFDKETPGRQEIVDLTLEQKSAPPGGRDTEIVMDLSQWGVPIHLIDWEVPERNFTRRVELSGSDQREKWTPLGASTIHRFTVEGHVEERTRLGVEGNYRFYRAVVVNGDNAPLTIKKARAATYVREIVFPARPEKNYSLYYGSPEARAPRYDVSSVVERLDLAELPEGFLAAEAENPRFAPPEKPWTDRNPAFLWIALALTVLVLGWLVLRAFVSVGSATGARRE